jgi:hypothetical protein
MKKFAQNKFCNVSNLDPSLPKAAGFHPSRKWPNAASGRTRSQMILVIASMGTERITPGIPHIQNQKTSEMIGEARLRRILGRYAAYS